MILTKPFKTVKKKPVQLHHGWLVLNKPTGISSAHALTQVKRALSLSKLGHAGTLDPLATGVLPVAVGEATKVMSYIVGADKEYRFTVKWGENTDTDDVTGQVMERYPLYPTVQQITDILPQFIGKVFQSPPIYSAIKISGKRSYQLARDQQLSQPLQPRLVEIFCLEIIEDCPPLGTTFFLKCGKGTYVRSLARDMGKILGTGGCVKTLHRLRVGVFEESHSISLETLKNIGHSVPSSAVRVDFLKPLQTGLDDIPVVCILVEEYQHLRCGRPVYLLPGRYINLAGGIEKGSPLTVKAMVGDQLVAIANIVGGHLKAKRVLNINF